MRARVSLRAIEAMLLVEIDLVDVAPAPFLSALGGCDDRVLRGAEVGTSVAIFRRVAAADMAAFQAHAQMHPGVAGF